MVASILHINIALSRALINKRDNHFKTQNLSQEVTYHLSHHHSINHSFEEYGVKNISQAFFILYVNIN